MKLVGAISRGFAYFCVGTIVAQLIVVAALWFRGALTPQRRAQIMAVMLDLDLKELGEAALSDDERVTSTSFVPVEVRVASSSELKVRLAALSGGLSAISGFQSGLKSERQRFEQLRVEFGILLSQREEVVRTESLSEVQHTLESLKPKESKAQLLRMLDDEAIDEVVTIVMAMPLDKRRKILGEFKSEDESRRLHEILLRIRESDDASGEDDQEPTR